MRAISARFTGRQGQPEAERFEGRPGRVARRASTSLLLPLFMLSLVLPIMLHAGPLRLSPYRLFLLALFIPCIVAWLSGQLGRIRLPDVLMLLYSVWGALTLMLHHGWAVAWQPSGILLLETFGAYLLARRLVRSQEEFRAMVRTSFWIVCVLLPFALIESVADRKLFLEALNTFANVIGNHHMEPRHGLYRAQVAFEHPILYGAFSASALGMALYVMGSGKSLVGRLFRTLPVTVAALFSLSSGAITAIAIQYGMIGWDRVTRSIPNRWLLLGCLFVVAYVVVDILSNRSPFLVFAAYLTLDPGTGYGRMLIWNYGSAEVLRNPLFGIGNNDWERPHWMLPSIDNFWLVVAVRHGLPAFVALAGAVLFIMLALGRAKLDNEAIRACRAGILVTLAGLVIAACTVHYWNAIYVWFMFMLGSGVWILDGEQRSAAVAHGNRPEATADKVHRGRHVRGGTSPQLQTHSARRKWKSKSIHPRR